MSDLDFGLGEPGAAINVARSTDGFGGNETWGLGQTRVTRLSTPQATCFRRCAAVERSFLGSFAKVLAESVDVVGVAILRFRRRRFGRHVGNDRVGNRRWLWWNAVA